MDEQIQEVQAEPTQEELQAITEIEEFNARLEFEKSERLWLARLSKSANTLLSPQPTHENHGMSDRVRFAQDMALIAIYERMASICRGDLAAPDGE